ncbi:MAG: hypothetical protein R3244_13785 [Thermoanaerobaculia bacterium]|nr:hypothetical protein [Thermoanaerobaculia bacterium]
MDEERSEQKVFVMNLSLKGSGFGLCILDTINQIRYCERENLIPVALYDASAESHFYDPEHGDSMWEQYFEPLGEYSARDLELRADDPRHPLRADNRIELDRSEIIEMFEQHEDSLFAWPYGRWRRGDLEDIESWYADQRAKGRQIVRRYIRPRAEIAAKVDDFWQAKLEGSYVLGVQIRGTDLHYAPPVSPAEYFESIDRRIGEHPDLKIFLATDQRQYVEVMRDRYGERLVSYDVLRSDDEVAPFKMDASPYKKGEDVLIDILLLARSDHLLRGASHVAEMAMYFGPDSLECTDLAIRKTKAFGQDYGKLWSYDASRPAWSLLKKTELDAVSDNAASQTPLETLIYAARSFTLNLARRLGLLRH